MVGVAPSSDMSWSLNRRPPRAITVPPAMEEKKATDAMEWASSLLPAPRLRDTRLPAPIPKVNPTAWMMAIREKTMPTAPLALVPSWDTKKVSAML